MNETLIRIILDILVIGFIILGILWKMVTKKKNNPGNQGNPGAVNLELIPGHSEECMGRGEIITKLVEAIKRIDKNLDNLWKHVKKNGTG